MSLAHQATCESTETLTNATSIELFGYNFSAPFFIAPAARAAWGDPDRAELNFMEAAGDENLLYNVSLVTHGY